MIGEICLTVAEYEALRQAIYNSHIYFGGVCVVIGFVVAKVPDIIVWYKENYGRALE